jgi:hypothetical protein
LALIRKNNLVKITQRGSFPELRETYAYKGKTATRASIEEAPKLTEKVINAPSLTKEQILYELNTDGGGQGPSLNVLPAFLITGYFWKMEPKIRKDYEINQQLLQQYDGCRVEIGFTVAQVDNLYGEPLRIMPMAPNETARIYGEDRNLEINRIFRYSNVAVVFDPQQRVSAVYSRGFFSESWIK